MSDWNDENFVVGYRPPLAENAIPEDVENYLLSLPSVSGFRRNDRVKNQSILVMVATADAAARLPKRFREYSLEPVVTGQFYAY